LNSMINCKLLHVIRGPLIQGLRHNISSTDIRLNFNSPVTAVCKKATNIYRQLARAAKIRSGLSGQIVRTIYVAVIEPTVTYGACAWAEATELQMTRRRLEAIQRGFAQKICKAYRTTSLTSVQDLSGTLPLDLHIQEIQPFTR
jgi:hypothetical protein